MAKALRRAALEECLICRVWIGISDVEKIEKVYGGVSNSFLFL